jgi:hypothetical protein
MWKAFPSTWLRASSNVVLPVPCAPETATFTTARLYRKLWRTARDGSGPNTAVGTPLIPLAPLSAGDSQRHSLASTAWAGRDRRPGDLLASAARRDRVRASRRVGQSPKVSVRLAGFRSWPLQTRRLVTQAHREPRSPRCRPTSYSPTLVHQARVRARQ